MRRSLKKKCRLHLQATFGLDTFRPGQKAAAYALLSGRDLLCVLPTGAGKSLCWQLPAVVRKRLTVVVSPLIALMRDQVEHLRNVCVPAVALNSLMTAQEREVALNRLLAGEARILFVAPERLETPQLQRLFSIRAPWLVVVDEAHCVVQWGEEFRPAYAAIGDFIRGLPQRPVVCALTATADAKLQGAITESLQMNRYKRIMLPMVRGNLSYQVHTTLDRTETLLRLENASPCKTVVFCRSRARTEQLAAVLRKHGYAAAHYHAGMDRTAREDVQQRFMRDEIDLLTATSAFGMGIDVPDIRRVVHDDLPASLTDYVQQAGRAGRDGLAAECILLLEPADLMFSAGTLHREMKRLRGHPIRRWRLLKKNWHPLRQLLQVMLTSECIADAITRAFGHRGKPCGRCTACQKGPLLHRIPSLPQMTQAQMIAFFLRWQRSAIAARERIPPRDVLSDRLLAEAADRLYLPQDAGAYASQLQRLLDHFLRRKRHNPLQ